MAKKIFALLLAAMLVLSLAACDSKTDDSSNNGDNSNNDNSANTEVSGLTEAIAEYPGARHLRWPERRLPDDRDRYGEAGHGVHHQQPCHLR